MKIIRLGLVGLKFGRCLLRAMTGIPSVEVIAVADRHATPDLLKDISTPPQARPYTDALKMIASEPLDGVVLAISPTHRSAILAACAGRGLPIFVEKPWAGNSTQARAFRQICEPILSKVMLGFSFRFHPAALKLKELLHGELGPVWMANAEYAFQWDDKPSWIWSSEGGGGIFNENSAHIFDLLCQLVGTPISLQASVYNPRNESGPELASVNLTFSSGAVAALSLGGLGASSFSNTPRMDVVTALGRASLRGRGHVWEELHWAARHDSAISSFVSPPEVLGSTRYTAALSHFAECVRIGAKPAATIDDGILAVDLASALAESAASGKSVMIAPYS